VKFISVYIDSKPEGVTNYIAKEFSDSANKRQQGVPAWRVSQTGQE
jgi:hypothetical protein